MNELRITRGRDILLYCNDEPLYGVIRFTAVSQCEKHAVGEYLSGEPVAVLNAGERHELSVKMLALFSPSAMDEDGFSLTVADGNSEYLYEDCVVTRRERDVQGDKTVTDSYTITARKMTKRGIQNAG